ncbi:hypothetical protein [Virgisporangium aurantiacum]|nr:hypothetical protein [Virgisporangium aurantiacum]
MTVSGRPAFTGLVVTLAAVLRSGGGPIDPPAEARRLAGLLDGP